MRKFHIVISDTAPSVIGVDQEIEAQNRTEAIAKAALIASECELEDPRIIEVTEKTEADHGHDVLADPAKSD